MSGVLRSAASIGAFVVGKAIGGATGGLIGSTLFGLLFSPREEGQNSTTSSDLGREGAEIGTPLKTIYGRIPVKCDVIDCGLDLASGLPAILREEKTTKRKGGIFGIGGTKVTTVKTLLNAATFLIAEGEYDLVKIKVTDGEGDKIAYDRDGVEKGIEFVPATEAGVVVSLQSATVRFWRGTERQGVDSALAAVHGERAVPYRGQCYLVFDNYEVAGGQASIEATVENTLTKKRQIIRRRMLASGSPSERIKLTSIEGDVEGCAIAQVEAARELIEKVAATEFHDLMWLDGAFRDVSRRNPATFRLDASEMGAYALGSGGEGEPPPRVNWSQKSARELPTILRLRFLDINDNYNASEAVAVRQIAGHESEVSVDYPVAAHLPEMVRLADIMMDELWAAQTTEQIVLLPRRMTIAPGNVLLYDANDGVGMRSMRVTKQGDIGAKGLVQCECVGFDLGAYGIFRPFVVPPKPKPTVAAYQVPLFVSLELPPLDSALLNEPVVLGLSSTLTNQLWGGAVLESSVLGETVFDPRARLGQLATSLSFNDDEACTWLEGPLRVTFDSPLQSGNEEDVLGGANLLAVKTSGGDALLSFTVATPVAGQSGTFDLSGLLLGRYGTQRRQTLSSGNRCALLSDQDGNSSPALEVLEVPLSALGQPCSYEVTAARDLKKTTGAQSLTPHGENVRPLPVANITRHDENGGGFTLSWTPRTRDFASVEASWQTGRAPRESDPRRFTLVLKRTNGTVAHKRVLAFDANAPLPLSVTLSAAEVTTIYGFMPSLVRGSLWQEGTFLQGVETPFER